MTEFLVQFKIDGEVESSLMNTSTLIKFIDMQDCMDIEEYCIFYSPSIGVIRKARYAGWAPNCYIAIIDCETGEIVADGYGTDH